LKRHNPKIRNARKPIKAMRKFRTVTNKPPRPITPSKRVTQWKITNNNQITPVINPKNIPKMPQEEWLGLIEIHPLSF
jgi:ribosomal protein L5